MNPADLAIHDAGAQLRAGSLTSVALTEAHLDRIAARDGVYHAFVTVTRERALEDAARADRELSEGQDRGPLHGIPIALKDLIDTAGIATTPGSRLFQSRVPHKDAVVATRLRDAGAVLLGKLMTYECLSRPRAIRGAPTTSPAVPPPVLPQRSQAVWSEPQSEPTPADRFAAQRVIAASSG
jgi:Asp-tRNA(Asn)/Glu-tRNA(Gln) amidotransferase A subunit family amidase